MTVPAQLEFAERAKAARARMARAARSVAAIRGPVMVVRARDVGMSDAEAAQIEALCLSALADAANTYCALRATSGNARQTERAQIEWIIYEVRTAACLTLPQFLSERRQAKIVVPRQFAMWRARNETTRSLPRIGRQFGDRDHTTVLHAVNKIDRMMAAGTVPAALLATLPPGEQA